MNDNLHFIEITTNLIVTNDDIDDIMCTALEGGITYWCGRAEVVGDYLGAYSYEQIARGGQLKLYDIEDFTEYVLNLDNFKKGLKMYIENHDVPLMFYNQHLAIDPCEIDAEAADAIVQYALFGDIVYG